MQLGDARLPYEFWHKTVEAKVGGCWPWIGSRDQNGYGRFWCDGWLQQAHRISYEALVGPIPEGLVIDHLCWNSRCVNPEHLEPVTYRENNLRGNNMSARHIKKTQCINGHGFTPENTYIAPQGHRICKTCRRARTKRFKEKQRDTTSD